MKILCIGRNYVEHIKELNNETPDEPVIFTKPDTALLLNNKPFYFPDYTKEIHHELEIIIRICKEGKSVEEKFASTYYDAIGLGIDFTARDLQQKAKAKGLPWALAKGFNGSAPISKFVPKEKFTDMKNINFKLELNNQPVQIGNTGLMINSIEAIIAYISKFITLKKGDIIFTGTPKGVGPVKIGDHLKGYLESDVLLDFEVK
jgi:acylpyruvate hydrolase